MKEGNYAYLDQKEEKEKILDFKYHIETKCLQIATMKSSTRLNMQELREEHYEALNASKHNGTKGTIEELDKLRQNIEDKT